MADDRFVVTGGLGCIGAWVIKRLAGEGVPVWSYDLGADPHRLRLLMSDETLASRVALVSGDIGDVEHLERVVVENRITHIVHLAALQIPAVRADPMLGARVNILGTTAALEIARRHSDQIQGLTYASSVAAYGPPELYPDGPPGPEAPLRPDTLYGVHKHTNEEMARVYWQDYGVATIGLRPYIIYGPGRDQGLTSTPTKAMLAAAVGRDYTISFNGKYVYQYADDAARAFIQCARSGLRGAGAFDLGGNYASMDEVVRAIESASPAVAGRIRYEARTLPFPPEVDGRRLEAVTGRFVWTPLDDAVGRTIAHFERAVAEGRLDVEKAMS